MPRPLKVPIDEARGERHHHRFEVEFQTSLVPSGNCSRCTGPTHRSPKTKILHDECFQCRYLVMIYGPGISVRYVPPEKTDRRRKR